MELRFFITQFLFGAVFIFSPGMFAEINRNPLIIDGSIKKVDLRPGENTTLIISYELAKKHIAYSDKLKITAQDSESVQIGPIEVTHSFEFYDKFTKKKKHGFKGSGQITAQIELSDSIDSSPQSLELFLTYQACTQSYCLLPKTIPFRIQLQPTNTQQIQGNQNNAIGPVGLLGRVHESGWFLTFITVFFAGVLTSLTPCIFPMIPITLAILGNKAHNRSKTKSFFISLVYVFGIATTYSLLGIIAASTGGLFGALLGHPIAIGIISLTFVVMGLSMFGAFEVQLPTAIRRQLTNVKPGQSFVGAYLSGTIAGVVASPCVGPVLIGILTYVAKTQNMLLGLSLLFTYAFGMGQLFLVMGTGSHLLNRLPKSGNWMVRIKQGFGVVMIFMAVFYAYPLLKSNFDALQDKKIAQTESRWKPYSEELILQAQKEGKAVIIDFWAEWCGACSQLEAETFSQQDVASMLDKSFVLIKFDATNSSDKLNKLREKYEILGLPHVAFYDTKGTYQKELTLTGFEAHEPFLKRINKLIHE